MENNLNKDNMTVWQRLNKTFGPDAQLNQDYPTYKVDKKQLLKTTSKDEYEKYLLKKDIKRDKVICKSLDIWFDGGSMSYLKKKERDDK